MNRPALAAAVALAATLAACGGGSASVSESDVVAAAGLQRDGATGNWVESGSGCAVPIILTSADDIRAYREAGDTVATNPAESAGVKVFAGKSTPIEECERLLADRLKSLD